MAGEDINALVAQFEAMNNPQQQSQESAVNPNQVQATPQNAAPEVSTPVTVQTQESSEPKVQDEAMWEHRYKTLEGINRTTANENRTLKAERESLKAELEQKEQIIRQLQSQAQGNVQKSGDIAPEIIEALGGRDTVSAIEKLLENKMRGSEDFDKKLEELKNQQAGMFQAAEQKRLADFMNKVYRDNPGLREADQDGTEFDIFVKSNGSYFPEYGGVISYNDALDRAAKNGDADFFKRIFDDFKNGNGKSNKLQAKVGISSNVASAPSGMPANSQFKFKASDLDGMIRDFQQGKITQEELNKRQSAWTAAYQAGQVDATS